MRTGVRMVPALLGALPAIGAAQNAPGTADAIRGIGLQRGRLPLALLLRELASHAAIIGDLDRLLSAHHPFRHDGLDIGPGADWLYEHALRFMVFGFCHC